MVALSDQSEFKAQIRDQINQLLAFIVALLVLAVLIAFLGIVNTLALSVFERTREIGLLRAVGTTRSQIRRMILVESVLIAVPSAAHWACSSECSTGSDCSGCWRSRASANSASAPASCCSSS